MPNRPKFFSSPAAFRAWLDEHHGQQRELWVGFYKRGSGKPSITWPEAVDEALCYGWIDGLRKSLEDITYMIRFTPRKPDSIWSAINIRRARALAKIGRMQPAGQKAFDLRDEERSEKYSYEQRKTAELGPYERAFRADPKAWAFFRAQPPWYQRTATWWVISAKKEETRRKRLAQLIEHSARQRPIPPLTRPSKPKSS